jgi:GNAT superfamily N-acetyltransferase
MIHEVLIAPRRALVPAPDTQIIERQGWLQIITPSFRDGGLNEVVFSAIDEAVADLTIDRTIEQYRRLGLQFRWTIGPGSRPADLGERLARRGLVQSWSRAMTRSTESLEPTSGVTIREVSSASVDLFTKTLAEGWQMDPAPLEAYNRRVVEDARYRLFVALVDREPAGAASVALLERSAYLIGAVVLPRFRRRGVYSALVAARLAAAREKGIPIATSQAREETSAPLLERLGFETLCRFEVYTNR